MLRACLDATRDADELLRDALGAKKLKELRRQRHRLAEHGAVRFDVARTPAEVAAAIETFLTLEASGWKGQRGTALMQDEGDAGFIRRASAGARRNRPMRDRDAARRRYAGRRRASCCGIRTARFTSSSASTSAFAKFSPGVQLTLDLTRHLCADPAIATADSTASPDHPMINPIWRGRLAIGDVLIPLHTNDPVVPLIHAALRRASRMPRTGAPRRSFRSPPPQTGRSAG